METYYCTDCLSKIIKPPGFIRCSCGCHYIFWASFEQLNWLTSEEKKIDAPQRCNILDNIPETLIEVMKKDGFEFV